MKTKILIEELDKIYSLLGLNYQKFDKNIKYQFLFAKDQIIRGKVIFEYTEINLFLDVLFYFYFFPKNGGISNKEHYDRIRKTKRFKYFNDYLLQDLSLLKKVRLLKEIMEIPNWFIKDIKRMNNLRNIFAHSWRIILANPSLTYKGKSIFNYDGIKLFLEDSERMQIFLQGKQR